MKEEIWKDIPGFEGLYQINNLGVVKCYDKQIWNRFSNTIRPGKIMTPSISKLGYPRLTLTNKNKKLYYHKISTLMAMTFWNFKYNKEDKIVVDHINNIKTDNRLENLQLLTQRQNISKEKILNKKSTSTTGVYKPKNKDYYNTTIHIEGILIHLCCCRDIELGSKIYQLAIKYENLFDGDKLKFKNNLKKINPELFKTIRINKLKNII